MDSTPIKRILATSDGGAFKAFLEQHIRRLNTLDGITATDPHAIAVQVEARKTARDLLNDIFENLLVLSETSNLSVDEESEYAVPM